MEAIHNLLGGCQPITEEEINKVFNEISIRLNELGITKGTKITKMLNNNGINAYYFKNTLIAIRNKDACNIIIGDIND